MKSQPKIFTLCLLAFTLFIEVAHSQYTVPPEGFCPMGDEVSLDTLFYSSKTSMPFDQCFYLRTSLKGNIKITHFTIVPINKKGEINHTPRDLHVFFKSGWTKPKSKDFPNRDLYKDAKRNYKAQKDKFVGNIGFWRNKQLSRQFDQIVSNYDKKTKRTNLVLKIPPLDPHREYKIEFWSRDKESLKKLVDIGALIFKSHQEENSYEENKILLSAERQFLNHPISSADLKSIGINNFKDYRDYNSLIDFSFNRDFSYNNISEYRLLFKQLNVNGSFSASQLSNAIGPPSFPHTKHKPTKKDPEKAKIIFPATDIAGGSLNAGEDYSLQVEILSMGSKTYRSNGNPVLNPNMISFDPIGLLELSESGTHAVFKANPLVPESTNGSASYRFFKHYRSMENSLNTIERTLSIHDSHNCFGLTQMSPCCNKSALVSIEADLDTIKDKVTAARSGVNAEITSFNVEKDTIEKRIIAYKDSLKNGNSWSFSFRLEKLEEYYNEEVTLDTTLTSKLKKLNEPSTNESGEENIDLTLLNEIASIKNRISINDRNILKEENQILRNESSKVVDKRQFTDLINALREERELLKQVQNKISYQKSVLNKFPQLDDFDSVSNVLVFIKANCDNLTKEKIIENYKADSNSKITADKILGNVIGYLRLLNTAEESNMKGLIECLTTLQKNFRKVRATQEALAYLGKGNSACPDCNKNVKKDEITAFLTKYLATNADTITKLNSGKFSLNDWTTEVDESQIMSNAKANANLLKTWINYLVSIQMGDPKDSKVISPVIACFNYLKGRFERMVLQEGRGDDLAKLFEKAIECTCEDEGCSCGNTTQDLSKETTLRTAIWVLKEGSYDKKLEEGLISFKDIYSEVSKEKQDSRIANLTVNIKHVKELISFTQKTGISQNRDYSTLLKNLNGQLGRMSAVKKELNAIASSQKQLIDSYFATFSHYSFVYKKTGANNSTANMDFKARSQFRIVPDFGFVAIGSNFNSSLRVTDFVPYLGFHINFRPINKKIPLRMIRYKNWKHRMSVMFGITTTSIAIENKREDLFGSANKSLLTALGFRVNNYFRINAGAVWFRSFDTNPFRGNKPLDASPFVGVSLDLEIKDLFGGLSSLVK